MAVPAPAEDTQGWAEVRRWRKARRASLLARRLDAARAERGDWSAAITARLGQSPALDGLAGSVGFYWPFRGEYDPRPLARLLHGRGVRLALPVLVERAKPLAFRAWWPGMRMRPGVWDIPVPDEGDWVRPEALLVPLLGFDPQGYRLGYGGGYYDRTLAAATPSPPLTIGIGFEIARLETIHPQPHDVPMDLIVTERQAFRGPAAGRSDAVVAAAGGPVPACREEGR
jgi:5-formyltetrahydrofolate cyclo-ligase